MGASAGRLSFFDFLVFVWFLLINFFLGLLLTEMAGTTADDLVDKLKQILVCVSVSEDQIMTLVTDGARNERAVGHLKIFIHLQSLPL